MIIHESYLILKDQDFLREEIITHILNTIATRAQQNASHYIGKICPFDLLFSSDMYHIYISP